MRLFLYSIVLLLMLVNASFAQSVWDSYSPKVSTPAEEKEQKSSQEESVYSAPVKAKIEYSSGDWYIGNRIASEKEVEALVQTDPEAGEILRSGKSIYTRAMILAAVGGAAIGWGAVAWEHGDSYGMPVTIGGIGVTVAALVMGVISGNRTTTAVEIYNKNIGYDTSLQIKIVPTPQGGTALAFAF
jgi:hypothetical protein